MEFRQTIEKLEVATKSRAPPGVPRVPSMFQTGDLVQRASFANRHARCSRADGLDVARHSKIIAATTFVHSRIPMPLELTQKERAAKSQAIAIIGGGVSGIWSALTLAELGYSNITIYEKELRVGGKASAFEHAGKKYPLGAVGTPLALEKASFTESQIFERPIRFAASLLGQTGRRLQVLNANNLIRGRQAWPMPFPSEELTSQTPVSDWTRAFGRSGRPERFYAHNVDFGARRELASERPVEQLIPRWGSPETSWPLVYVSAHGYGVAAADDCPPFYYWARFAQKSTNAGAAGVLGTNGPLGWFSPLERRPIGPRGPALRGWDSTSLFEKKLAAAGIRVRTGVAVSAIDRGGEHVTVRTADGGIGSFEQLVLATDLKGSLAYLDADEEEREIFAKIRHMPYYTVASFISLPWLATGSVYYMGDHQGPSGAGATGRGMYGDARDAGRATAGCPTILLKANRGSNLTISWAYGGEAVGPTQIEACLRREVVKRGGRFDGVLFIKQWPDYFPHFGAADLRSNILQRLDRRQGRKRTFMVGEVFNLPLVSECVDWARYLIRRHFGGTLPGGRQTGAAEVVQLTSRSSRIGVGNA